MGRGCFLWSRRNLEKLSGGPNLKGTCYIIWVSLGPIFVPNKVILFMGMRCPFYPYVFSFSVEMPLNKCIILHSKPAFLFLLFHSISSPSVAPYSNRTSSTMDLNFTSSRYNIYIKFKRKMAIQHDINAFELRS